MFSTIRRSLIIPLAGSLLLSPSINSAEDKSRWASVTLDNDLLVGTDGGYTNGLYVTLYSVYNDPEERLANIPWYLRLQEKMQSIRANDSYIEVMNFGQIMVTPSDITQVPPDPEDTPYAGLLFWQNSIISVHDNGADLSSFIVGVLGPSSGAEQSQKFVHKITGSQEPLGWDYQVDDEPVIGFSRSRFWRSKLAKKGNYAVDFVTGIEGGLSTIEVEASASAYLRWGKQLDQSHATFAMVSTRESNPLAYNHSFYIYLGGGIGYSLYDFYRDGSLFQDTPEHDIGREIGFATVGAAWSKQNWGFSFSVTDSNVFEGEAGDETQFASLSVLWKY